MFWAYDRNSRTQRAEPDRSLIGDRVTARVGSESSSLPVASVCGPRGDAIHVDIWLYAQDGLVSPLRRHLGSSDAEWGIEWQVVGPVVDGQYSTPWCLGSACPLSSTRALLLQRTWADIKHQKCFNLMINAMFSLMEIIGFKDNVNDWAN